MRFKHTNRPGFWLGFIDFFTAGIFFDTLNKIERKLNEME